MIKGSNMTSVCPFVFADEAPIANDILVTIPKNIQTKKQLLDIYSEKASFPEYFGHNWDALIDCLSDLTWFNGKSVVIVHEDLPLRNDDQQVRIYLESLCDSLDRWQQASDKQLTIFFPSDCRARVFEILSP